MIKQIISTLVLVAATVSAQSAEIPIRGMVTSKCVINTDTAGVFGNPVPNLLSTARADGGLQPVVRYDVVQGGFYKATITTPTEFTTSPVLPDVVNWTGLVDVTRVSDVAMSAYTTNKIVYNNTSEFDLTVPGSVWFSTTSKANYGFEKSFPAGEYRAVIIAECIAK